MKKDASLPRTRTNSAQPVTHGAPLIGRTAAPLLGRTASGPAGPWLVALLALGLVWGYWLLSARVNYQGDLTGQINVGQFFLNKSPEPFKPRVQIERHVGFDGQFFLYLACDPLLRRASTLKRLDSPFLRARRIGYPLVVWALTRGRAERAPRMMFWVCAGAIAAASGLLAGLLRRQGAAPALALLFTLSFPLIMSFHWLTAESLALALVAGSVISLEKQRAGMALALAMAAGLTKEVTLIWPLAVVLDAAACRDWRRAGLFCLAPLPLFCWIGYLYFGLHLHARATADTKNFAWPYVGAWRRLLALARGRVQDHHVYPLAEIPLVGVVLAAPLVAAWGLIRERTPAAIALGLAALISVSVPTGEAWWAASNAIRQAFLMVLFLFIVAARAWPRKTAAGALAGISALAGVAYLGYVLLAL